MHAQTNAVPYLQFDIFPADGHQQHAVFTRQGGVSHPPFASLNLSTAVQDNPSHVRENRNRAYGIANRTFDTLVHAKLAHKADVARVTAANHGQIMPFVDGLITNEPGCGLTMNYGDCTPIMLYDPRTNAIGVGHAGWKGAMVDLPGAMVRAMVREFHCSPADILASVGPCISVTQYEVGENVITAAQAAFGAEADRLLVDMGKERPHFDLPGANLLNLQRAGVEKIETAVHCTASRTDLFFSHRAEKGRTGRFGVLFVLHHQ